MGTRYFNETEVKELIWGTEVKRKTTGSNRWTVDVESIVESEDGKFFEVCWREAATEMQEHEFWGQDAVEVEKVTKQITVTDWFPVEDSK